MAKANKCDRCGIFYESYNEKNDNKKTNGFTTLNIDVYGKYYTHEAHDLCPTCNESLHDWFENCKPEEQYPINGIGIDDEIDILECKAYIDSDEDTVSNDGLRNFLSKMS